VVAGLAGAGAAVVVGTAAPAPGLPGVPAPGLPGFAAQPGPSEAAGRALYLTACSSCHGADGRGTDRAPSLVGVGAASADFQLSTGRMPADRPSGQSLRKEPAYSRTQIDELVAYVASLGPGPEIPRIDLSAGKLSEGTELYARNCASCHSSAGAGGALGKAVVAPSLRRATSTQVAEAVRIGPGAMPRFGPDSLDDGQVASIVRYVRYLHRPEDRGGAGLGHLGPLPEGFVAWLVGLGACLVAIRWIGTTD
jgi:ubiquinol-cytochrome c reductase cytochrome c subunit